MTATIPSRLDAPELPAQPEYNPPRGNYKSRGVPTVHIVTSLLGLGPIPFRGVIHVLALVREQHNIGVYRSAKAPSHLELEIRTTGAQGAILARDKGLRQLSNMTFEVGRLQARISYLESTMSNQDSTPLHGPHGESLTLSDAAELEKKLRNRVDDEAEGGSLKHRRASSSARRMAWIAPPIDLPVLCYFLGEVFNVNWQNPADGLAGFGATIVFALLGTVALALGLRALGRDMRAHKNNKGQLELPQGWRDRILPLLELIATAAVIAGAGVIMACRIIVEAGPDTISKPAAVLLGIFFAVVTIIVNWIVYAAEFRDGSILTDQIDTVAGTLIEVGARRQKLSKEVHELQEEVAKRKHERQQVAADTLATVDAPMKAADKLILKARSYHLGTGWEEAKLLDPLCTNGPSGFIEPHFSVDVSLLQEAAKPCDDSGSKD